MSIKKILVCLMILALSSSFLVAATKPKIDTIEFDLVEINGYPSFYYGVFNDALETDVGDLEVSILVDADYDTEDVMFDVFIRGTEIIQTIGPIDFKADTYTTINLVLDVPNDFPLGEHTVRIEVSKGCGDQGIMNIPFIFTEGEDPEAELRIKSTTIVPGTVRPDEQIVVTTVIENTGDKSISDIDVDFEIEAFDEVKSANIPLLPSGASATVEVTLDIPKDADDGTENLKVVVEYEDKQISKEYGFNIDSDDKSRKSADLKIGRALLLRETVQAGDMVEVLINLENAGDKELDNVEVTVALLEMGYSRNVNFGDISGRREKTQIIPLDIPYGATAGHYTLRISARSDEDRRVLHRDIEII